MKGFKGLPVLWSMALAFAACALPLGEDYLLTRDGSGITYITDYMLQNYVPIPKTGEGPVSAVNRGDLDIMVVWKDSAGMAIPLPFDEFRPDTVYQAEIKLSAKDGYGFYPSTPFAYPGGKVSFQYDDLGEPSRIIRVIYNNSDDAELTFITDYNLQWYIPIPLAGEKPVRTVTSRLDLTVEASWKMEDPPDSNNFVAIPAGDSYTFVRDAVYQAEIQLAAKPGYRFFAGKNFEYPVGTVGVQPGPDSDPADRVLTTTYQATQAGTMISDLNLTPYIARPVSGAAALNSFIGMQYTGTVVWKNTGTQVVLDGPFQAGEEYTAEVSLVAAVGYIFTGVGVDTFIHTGAKGVSNGADSGMVRIEFSAIPSAGGPKVVYDTNLTGRIPKPVSGVTPVRNIAGNQYAGTVTWVPSPHTTFLYGTVYRAVLTLNAAPAHTFSGIGQNVFTHDDASGALINAAGSGVVTITFPPTASATYTAITRFGPVEAEGSALKMMKEKKGDNSLTIDLPGGAEPVVSNGAALEAGTNSPAKVVINGHGRVLNIQAAGTLLTVGGGVTLTLRDITLSGMSGNTAPQVTVQNGGKLILGDGVIFTGNQSTTGSVGGIWVNGGELVLNNGGVIKGMKARQGGGVLIDAGGKFVMNSGIIGGASGDGNTVSGENGGGGVLVADGSFFMLGGIIQSNQAEAARSGGGVAVLTNGTFSQYGGTIKGNRALWSTPGADVESGGAVFLMGEQYGNRWGYFNMYGGTIGGEDPGDANTADIGGNGVCVIFADFTLGGTIKWNKTNSNDHGVYVRTGSTGRNFIMTRAAVVDGNNKVFLYPDSMITIGEDLDASPAANIITNSPVAGTTKLLRASSSDLIVRNYDKFLYDDAFGHINSVPVPGGDYYGQIYCGVYQDPPL